MAQIAEIVMAVLGLCGVVSLNAICITILACEAIRIIYDVLKRSIE